MASSGEKPLIFVSCGQYTEEEKRLGLRIAELISELTEAEGFFAENQTTLAGVSDHIIKAIARCSGFVAIMHRRGTVNALGSTFQRASVWIEQELAIAAFLQQIQGRSIPVVLYMQDGIRLEGLREKLLLNPFVFNENDHVVEHFREKGYRAFSDLAASDPDEKYSTESPWGQKKFPAVTLIPAAVNPDFILGTTLRPTRYSKIRRILDRDDEQYLSGLELESRRPGSNDLHEALSLKSIHSGVVFSTPDTGERRQDNSVLQPEQQIMIESDGDMVFRFRQNSNNPLFQYLALIGTTWLFLKRVYPWLGLRPSAHCSIKLQLHAERLRSQPVLPGHFGDDFQIDAQVQSFAEAFELVTLQLMNQSGVSQTRGEVNEFLHKFWAESLASF